MEYGTDYYTHTQLLNWGRLKYGNGTQHYTCNICAEKRSETIRCNIYIYLHELTLVPAWINNHMPSKVWDENTYRFLNFNCTTVDVLNEYIKHFTLDVIT